MLCGLRDCVTLTNRIKTTLSLSLSVCVSLYPISTSLISALCVCVCESSIYLRQGTTDRYTRDKPEA